MNFYTEREFTKLYFEITTISIEVNTGTGLKRRVVIQNEKKNEKRKGKYIVKILHFKYIKINFSSIIQFFRHLKLEPDCRKLKDLHVHHLIAFEHYLQKQQNASE